MPQRCDARLISQFQMLSWLFLLVSILTFCQVWGAAKYECGSVSIAAGAECQCGNKTFSYDDSWRQDTECCGKRGDCVLLPDGGAVCKTGTVCSGRRLWNCGDTRISRNGQCKCGSVTLQKSSYLKHEWCCGDCSYEEDTGDANCPDGVVMRGSDKSCNGQYCVDDTFYLCQSGDCIKTSYYGNCHGYRCSDVDICNSDDLQCDYDLCPGFNDAPATGHQECYNKDEETNDGVYNCLNRADERNLTRSEEIIDYESITPCEDWNDPGLMCGEDCKSLVYEWCNIDRPSSCRTNSSVFTKSNPQLCQNKTFWQQHNNTCHSFWGTQYIILVRGAEEESCTASFLYI